MVIIIIQKCNQKNSDESSECHDNAFCRLKRKNTLMLPAYFKELCSCEEMMVSSKVLENTVRNHLLLEIQLIVWVKDLGAKTE